MPAGLNQKSLVVVTDLDGTMLEQRTYSFEQSWPTIEKLRHSAIPLVLCSSKTAAEIMSLQRQIEIEDPFICESGGAIYMPRNYFPFEIAALKPRRLVDVIEFGKRIVHLRQALQDTAQACAATVESFGTMTLQEIISRTGLTLEQAIQARQREYDEPFLIDAGDEQALLAALRAQGLTVTKGDLFFHLTGGHDKGDAVRTLLGHYRRQCPSLVSIGLGNSANDLPLLRQTDVAVIVRNPDGSWDGETTAQLPAATRTDGIGPAGWREAIDRLLDHG
jgi:mannosyl-3-phosphoglycerate phosphatase family protein